MTSGNKDRLLGVLAGSVVIGTIVLVLVLLGGSPDTRGQVGSTQPTASLPKIPQPVAVQPQVAHRKRLIVNTFVHYGGMGKGFISPWSNQARQLVASTNVYSQDAREFVPCEHVRCVKLTIFSGHHGKRYVALKLKSNQQVTYANFYYVNRYGSRAAVTSPRLGKPVPVSITRTIKGSIEYLRLGYVDIEIHDPGQPAPPHSWMTDGSCTRNGCG